MRMWILKVVIFDSFAAMPIQFKQIPGIYGGIQVYECREARFTPGILYRY